MEIGLSAALFAFGSCPLKLLSGCPLRCLPAAVVRYAVVGLYAAMFAFGSCKVVRCAVVLLRVQP